VTYGYDDDWYAPPLVSVITPTWQRHNTLLGRCIPSVSAQTYPHVEHVIVSDGPDDELRARFMAAQDPGFRRLILLDEHPAVPHWGTFARRAGLEAAQGEFITYNDDDDALRTEHCALLAQALIDNPDAGFAYSWMLSHNPSGDHTIGDCVPPVYGQLGSPMIMHRRSVLEFATWGEPDAAEDWKLVELWIASGVQYVPVKQVTVDVYPSTFANLL
jgi:glycosyltransferase involved in cell wall biosynthesis